MELFTRTIEGKEPRVMLLHGLYSSSSNWYPVARLLGYTVQMVDLPNHGRSPWSGEFSYRALADAVKPLIDSPTVLIGHSFGGRVAMMLARECPQVIGLVVVDISPVASLKVDRVFTMCHAMFLQHLLTAKRENVTDIESYLKEKGVAADMTSAVDQAYRQMNIEVVADSIMKLPAEWAEISAANGIEDKPALFVRGGASPYILDAYVAEFDRYYSNFRVETVDGGTHRLHHEFPEEFVKIVKNFIENDLSNRGQ